MQVAGEMPWSGAARFVALIAKLSARRVRVGPTVSRTGLVPER